jgi:hypothetical protein
MVQLLSETHGLRVWRSLLSHALRGSAEERRDDKKYPTDEGDGEQLQHYKTLIEDEGLSE